MVFRRFSHIAALSALLCLALLGATPCHAQETAGRRLLWVELSVGGTPVRINAGGVTTLHPDAPFRVLGAKSDAWLDMGLSWRLKDMPEVDLGQYHTLLQLLGKKIYTTEQVDLQVLHDGKVIGGIRILVRLLPIDWLRRAQEAQSLDDKIAYTTKALELTPDDDLLASRLADLLIEAGRWQEAAALLSSHARSKEDPRWLAKLADLYVKLGDHKRAAASLSKLTALMPQNVTLLGRLADQYVALERWDEAQSVLMRQETLVQGQEKSEVLVKLAQVQQKAGQPALAIASLQKALAINPRQADLWKDLARLKKAAGDTAGALAALDQAAALSPRDRGLHLELAADYMAAKQKRRAAMEFEKAAALQPDDPAPLMTLSKIYAELGDRKALASVYQRLSKMQPSDPDLKFNLAVLLAEQGKNQQALKLLDEAAKERPKDREINELSLDLAMRLGKWGKVESLAAKLLSSRPADPELLDRLFAGMSQKQPKRLAKILDQVLAKEPKEVKPYQMRAALALEAGDNSAALEALQGAALIKPKDVKLLFQIANLLEAEDQEQEAFKLYEKILDQDPDFPGAQERYLALRTKQLRQSKQNGGQQKQ